MIYAFYPFLNYSLKVSSQKRDYWAKGYDFLACDSSFQTVFERLTTLHCSLRLSFIMMLIMFLFFFLNEFTIYLSFTQLTSYSFECWWVEHFLNVFFLAAACFSWTGSLWLQNYCFSSIKIIFKRTNNEKLPSPSPSHPYPPHSTPSLIPRRWLLF